MTGTRVNNIGMFIYLYIFIYILTRDLHQKELLETAKPYKDDPAKQARFEQFLKDKYQGGLRATDSGKATYMSEAARARERLDFEAAAEAIQKTKSANQSKLSGEQLSDFTMATGMQFTSGGVQVSFRLLLAEFWLVPRAFIT